MTRKQQHIDVAFDVGQTFVEQRSVPATLTRSWSALRTLLWFLAVLSACVAPRFALAQTADTYYDLFRGMDNDLQKQINDGRVLRNCANESTRFFWAGIKAIKEESDFQRRLRGKASFGFQGDEVEGDEGNQFKLDVALDLTRGSYPGEFKFASQAAVRLKDGSFEEDVTNLNVAYDYYVDNPGFIEVFAFAGRHSDNFMRIDQRYEVGGGAFLGGTIGRIDGMSTPDGMREASGVSDPEGQPSRRPAGYKRDYVLGTPYQPANEQWHRCYEGLAKEAGRQAVPASTIIENVSTLWEEAETAQLKRHARFRLGVSFAIFSEFEQVTLVEDFEHEATGLDGEPLSEERKFNLDGTQRYRWSIRPTAEWQVSRRARLTSRWYWKLPLGDARTTALNEDNEVAGDVFDYRYDLDARLVYSVKESEIGQPGNVDLAFRYRRYFDNAPPFLRAADPMTATPEVLMAGPLENLSAPRSHDIVTVSLAISWK